MKRFLLSAISSLTRSDFSARGDALRTESRADVARKCTEGKAWEGMRANVALLGIKTDTGSRLKVRFAGR